MKDDEDIAILKGFANGSVKWNVRILTKDDIEMIMILIDNDVERIKNTDYSGIVNPVIDSTFVNKMIYDRLQLKERLRVGGIPK